MPTLKDNYKVDDVVYGVADARAIYLSESLDFRDEEYEEDFDEKLFKKIGFLKEGQSIKDVKTDENIPKDLNFVVIDQFNAHEVFDNLFARDADYDEYATILQSAEYKELELDDPTPIGLRKYWSELILSKYSPEKLPKLSDEETTQDWEDLKRKYPEIDLLSAKLEKTGMANHRQKLKYLALRRACKFGIGFIVSCNQRVHFVLDDINMWDVTTKRLVNLPGGEGPRVSITTSELTYVYRNWSTLKGKVLFYRRTVEVPPPWTWDEVIEFDGMPKQDPPTVKAMWEMYDAERKKRNGLL